MALKIHVVKRKILAGEEAGREKYYGQVRMNQVVSLDTLCERVSASASVTASDVELVIGSLVHVITTNLEGGKVVDLGGMGSMRLSGGSKGALSEDLFKAHLMRRPRVVFTPGKLLNHMLDEVKFEWLPEITRDYREPCPEIHQG